MTKSEIFKKSCLSCAPLGITPILLNQIKEQSNFTIGDIKAAAQEYFSCDDKEYITPEAASAVKYLVNDDSESADVVLGGILSMSMLTSVRRNEINILLCKYLYLMAQQGCTVSYIGDFNLDLCNDYTQFIYDRYAESNEVTANDFQQLARKTFSVEYADTDTVTDVDKLAAILQHYYNDGDMKSVVQKLADAIKVSPPAGLMSDTVNTLLIAMENKEA